MFIRNEPGIAGFRLSGPGRAFCAVRRLRAWLETLCAVVPANSRNASVPDKQRDGKEKSGQSGMFFPDHPKE